MKNKLISIVVILIGLISFSEVMRVKFINTNGEIQRFSTKNREFSDDFDLIVPEIHLKENQKHRLVIRFLEKGETDSFRKIEITNGVENIVYNFIDGEVKIDFDDEDKVVLYVEKEINLEDAIKLFKMCIEKNKIKINFINEEKGTVTQEVNAKEKEILKWTILNYGELL